MKPKRVRERRVPLPTQARAASARTTTFNAETREIEIVWTTGATVRRMDWWSGKEYDERLLVTDKAVDLGRLNSGRAPVLDSHNPFGLRSQLGVVLRAWIEGGEGHALIQLSDREEIAGIVRDIGAGVISNVSVGYDVKRYEVDKPNDGVETWTAVEWEPCEISFVTIPADAGAGTRAADGQGACTIAYKEAATMKRRIKGKAAGTAATAPGAGEKEPTTVRTEERRAEKKRTADLEAARAEAAKAERQRAAEIRKAGGAVGLPAEFIDDLVARGVSLGRARKLMLDETAKRAGEGYQPATIGRDSYNPETMRTLFSEVLVARGTAGLAQAGRVAMPAAGREWANASILDLCAELARARGDKIGRHDSRAAIYDRLCQRGLGTSDFPILLSDAANKILSSGYQLAAPNFKAFFARKRFTDFKAHKFIRQGDFPLPLLRGENGEFQYGSMGEAKQNVTMLTYGRVVQLSREAIINDDLGAFVDLPLKAGQRIADFENATAFAIFALNSGAGPTIDETGAALFHTATHGNLAGSGAAIDVTSVGAGRAAMMKQTSIDGVKLNLVPAVLLTSPDKLTIAQQFAALPVIAATDANTNPFKGVIQPIGDANLSGNAWYLFAAPGQAETVMYGYLEGSEGPQMMTREGFITDGVEWRVRDDFVASAIDYRGAYKNPGA